MTDESSLSEHRIYIQTIYPSQKDNSSDPVVKKADSTIHWIEIISIQWIVQLVSLILIHWIVIYPLDSAIQLLNNQGL